ncbi:MAG: sensor histidine kinase [Planctomycetaceae bacterium]
MPSPLRIAVDEDRPAIDPSSLTQLAASAMAEMTLEATLAAVARWWSHHMAGRSVSVGVTDTIWPAMHLAEARQDQVQSRSVENCILSGHASARDLLFHSANDAGDGEWLPLVWDGNELGGVLIEGADVSMSASTSTDAVFLTACALAAARSREQRLRDEKLSALAEFAAGAGHEINNPLGSILGRVQLLSRDESSPDHRRQLATIGAQALRVRDMIGDAMLFARPPIPQPQSLLIADAVDNVRRQFATQALARRIHLTSDGPSNECWHADPVQLRIVLSELVRNALHAGPENTSVQLNWRREHEGVTSVGVLDVIDSGPGLSPTDIQHLFDPFYSGRQAGRGLGFGLSKCWRIVTGHGGCLHARNRNPGLQITVHWPLSPEMPDKPSSSGFTAHGQC